MYGFLGFEGTLPKPLGFLGGAGPVSYIFYYCPDLLMKIIGNMKSLE